MRMGSGVSALRRTSGSSASEYGSGSPALGMVYQLVPIEDLAEEEEEIEDSEIEEGLAIEIAALDLAPAYSI